MPEATVDFEAIAEEIAAARSSGGRLAPFSDRVAGFGLDEAYRVAGIFACRRAASSPVIGRKIGFTNRSLWDAAGLDQPVWGVMYEKTVTFASDDGSDPPTIAMTGSVEPKIECEVVVRLASTPEPGERGAAVARRLSAVGLGFEIVDSPYPGWKMRPADAVAAGGIHHGLAVGPMIPVTDAEAMSEALVALTVSMTRPDSATADGEHFADGAGSLVLGNPLDAVGVLAELTAALSNPLEPGEVITTGTLTPPLPVRAGEHYRAEAAGDALPTVAAALI